MPQKNVQMKKEKIVDEPSREPEWHRFSLTPLLVSCMASSKLVESTKMFSLGTRVAKFV